MQVREASQALLLAELRRIGAEGRRRLIQEWSPFMPNLIDDFNGSISLADVEDNGSDDDGMRLIIRWCCCVGVMSMRFRLVLYSS